MRQETLKYGSKGRNFPAYSDRGEQAIRQGNSEIAEAWFDQAAEYWKQAIALTPGNYIEAQNWLKITRRFEQEHSVYLLFYLVLFIFFYLLE